METLEKRRKCSGDSLSQSKPKYEASLLYFNSFASVKSIYFIVITLFRKENLNNEPTYLEHQKDS